MKIIGITGGSGSGKSTVSKIFEENLNHLKIIHIDQFMHKLTDEKKDIFIKTYGNEIMNGNKIDLSFFVKNIDRVNHWIDVIHNDVIRETKLEIAKLQTYDFIVLDWAFLPLTELWQLCTAKIVITADIEVKIKRLKNRLIENEKDKNWNDQQLIQRLKLSLFDVSEDQCDYIINNNGDMELLINQVMEIIRKL